MVKHFLLVTSVLVLLYIGCGFVFDTAVFLSQARLKFSEAGEELLVKETVMDYNKIYSDLYASDGSPLRLNDFPANRQLKHELYRHLGFLRQKNLVLVFDMADIFFEHIDITSCETAEAYVYEEWNYMYQRYPERETAIPIKGMGQGFRYWLIKRSGTWQIVDYMPVDTEIKKGEKFYY